MKRRIKYIVSIVFLLLMLHSKQTTSFAFSCSQFLSESSCNTLSQESCFWYNGTCSPVYTLVPAGSSFSSVADSIGSTVLPKYPSSTNIVSALITTLIPVTLLLAGLALFLLILAGGFQIMTAVQNPDQADAGKQKITAALIGFIIIFSSYWIGQFLEVITGITIFG